MRSKRAFAPIELIIEPTRSPHHLSSDASTGKKASNMCVCDCVCAPLVSSIVAQKPYADHALLTVRCVRRPAEAMLVVKTEESQWVFALKSTEG